MLDLQARLQQTQRTSKELMQQLAKTESSTEALLQKAELFDEQLQQVQRKQPAAGTAEGNVKLLPRETATKKIVGLQLTLAETQKKSSKRVAMLLNKLDEVQQRYEARMTNLKATIEAKDNEIAELSEQRKGESERSRESTDFARSILKATRALLIRLEKVATKTPRAGFSGSTTRCGRATKTDTSLLEVVRKAKKLFGSAAVRAFTEGEVCDRVH